MQQINLDHIQQRLLKPTAPHQQADKVNRIREVIDFTDRFGYGFWLKRVKNRTYAEIDAICKKAESLDKKYNKGGYLNNQLR